MKRLLACGLFCLLLGLASPGRAEEAPPQGSQPRGTLLIIGGGLRPDNLAIFQKLIAAAGGSEKARFVLIPSASKTDRPAREFGEILIGLGVPPEHVAVVDLMPENAERQAANPEVVEQIRRATGIFFAGGDQSRIISSLLKADRRPTPALAALEEMWHAGGVIAGSSAGAAVQSTRMLRVAGLPDESLDVGMDVLDFGLCSSVRRRGLLVTKGLGFFKAGIVDQHFSQFRGRLGRLSRALIDEHVRFGFGIDENTAIAVLPGGMVEVVGGGSVTIIDAAGAHCADGPLGCHLSGLALTYLQAGDRFDTTLGTAVVRPEKKLIAEGTQDYSGNHLITDISAPAAVPWAICMGLAENRSRKQEGVTLRYNQGFAHGYRFTFTEAHPTRIYGGYADHFYSYAAVDVQLAIEPVLGNLQIPAAGLPVDLPAGEARTALEALWFRGILLADEQHRLRPAAAITRGELAGALVQTIHLIPAHEAAPKILDVADSAAEFNDVTQVVVAGLMTLDKPGQFRPGDAVTRAEAAVALVKLAKLLGTDFAEAQVVKFADEADIPPTSRDAAYVGLVRPLDGQFRPSAAFTRQEAALAICQLVGFAWDESPRAAVGRRD